MNGPRATRRGGPAAGGAFRSVLSHATKRPTRQPAVIDSRVSVFGSPGRVGGDYAVSVYPPVLDLSSRRPRLSPLAQTRRGRGKLNQRGSPASWGEQRPRIARSRGATPSPRKRARSLHSGGPLGTVIARQEAANVSVGKCPRATIHDGKDERYALLVHG